MANTWVGWLIRGRVTVGMVTACTVTGLFDVLANFYHNFPGVEITLSEDRSDLLVDAVRVGQLDVALVGLAGLASCQPLQPWTM